VKKTATKVAAGDASKASPKTRSSRPGLSFPVSGFHKFLKEGK
jgi:hypothetical protein